MYNKDQIDQIGSLIGKKLSDLNRDLRIFIEESLPESSSGTTPSAGGMFLADGREIKQTLYEVVIPDTPNTNFVIKYISPPLDMSKVISSTAILLLRNTGDMVNRQENQYGESRYWEYSLRKGDINVNGFENKTYFYGATVKILVTSLV